MKFRTAIVWLTLLISVSAAAEPRSKSVELHKRTNLTVYVVPDLGVRLTFPFILDEQDAYVPYTLNMTNPAFINKRESGRNYVVITTSPATPVNMLGNIFMTVAGFEISVELKTTHDLSKHYSDIVFELTKDAREELIQQSIAQRSAALEQDYKTRVDALDVTAERKALALVGRLAATSPKIKGIKEEGRLKLPDGNKATVYVDKIVRYGSYSIILFDVEADMGNKSLTVLDAQLFAVDPATKEARPIEAFRQLPGTLRSNDVGKGELTLLDSSLPAKGALRLQLLTDKGAVQVEW